MEFSCHLIFIYPVIDFKTLKYYCDDCAIFQLKIHRNLLNHLHFEYMKEWLNMNTLFFGFAKHH